LVRGVKRLISGCLVSHFCCIRAYDGLREREDLCPIIRQWVVKSRLVWRTIKSRVSRIGGEKSETLQRQPVRATSIVQQTEWYRGEFVYWCSSVCVLYNCSAVDRGFRCITEHTGVFVAPFTEHAGADPEIAGRSRTTCLSAGEGTCKIKQCVKTQGKFYLPGICPNCGFAPGNASVL